MKRIDAHAHVTPQAYVDAVPAPGGNLPKPPAVGAEALLAMMDRYAIDAAVISTGPPGAFFGDQARANEIARLANELIAATVHDTPSRFAGLAMLPLPDPDAALAELAHALDEMGFDGVLLLSHVAGTYLGDPLWEPLYAELDRRGAGERDAAGRHPGVHQDVGLEVPRGGVQHDGRGDRCLPRRHLGQVAELRLPHRRGQVAVGPVVGQDLLDDRGGLGEYAFELHDGVRGEHDGLLRAPRLPVTPGHHQRAGVEPPVEQSCDSVHRFQDVPH